jgi:hypothetical protein
MHGLQNHLHPCNNEVDPQIKLLFQLKHLANRNNAIATNSEAKKFQIFGPQLSSQHMWQVKDVVHWTFLGSI